MARGGWQVAALLCLQTTALIFSSLFFSAETAKPVLLDATVFPPVYVDQYLSYASVKVFRFDIPPMAVSATWKLMANRTDPSCPAIDVYMALQPGGYPLVTPRNETFPADFHLDRDDLRYVRLKSNGSCVSHVVTSPVAGPWYGFAYAKEHNNVVIKKITDAHCRFTLATNVSVSGWEVIPEILTGNIHHPQRFRLMGDQTLSYLRFLIDKRTWAYVIEVSKCIADGVTLKRCPLLVYARSGALPTYGDEENVLANCSRVAVGQPCRLRLEGPVTDVYQYVKVLKPGVANVSFAITVTLKECGAAPSQFFSDALNQAPVALPKKVHTIVVDGPPTGQRVPPAAHITHPPIGIHSSSSSSSSPSSTISLTTITSDSSSSASPISSIFNTTRSLVPPTEPLPLQTQLPTAPLLKRARRRKRQARADDVIVDPGLPTNFRDTCINAMALFRTTEAGNNFLTMYALKPTSLEFVENLVPVPTLFARIFYFDVVPHQDSGGTLRLGVQFHGAQDTSKVQTNITACLQHGEIPVDGSLLRCHPQNLLVLSSSSPKLLTRARYLPYPRQGIWYLGLQQVCYIINNTTHREQLVPCPHQVVMTLFDLRIMACVDQGCGQYGQCREYFGASYAYSVCNCKAGVMGYACDDWSQADSRSRQMLYTLLLTLSNLFFIPAICVAIYRCRYPEAFIYFSNMFFSSFYHACDMGPWSVYTLCIMPYHVLQFCDFFCSIMSFWVTLIAVSEISGSLYSLAHLIGVIGLAMAVEWEIHGFLPYAVPISMGVFIVIISFAVKSYRRKKWYPGCRRLIMLVIGLLFAVAGICFFTFIETDKNYPYTHSVWHATMSLSIIFFLPPRPTSFAGSGSVSSASDDSLFNFNPETNNMVSFVPADRVGLLDDAEDEDDKDDELLQDF